MNEAEDSFLIAGMVTGMSRSEMAASLDITASELRNALARPEILLAIAEAEADGQRELLGRLRVLSRRAVQALSEVLIMGDDVDRVQAAGLVLNQAVRQRPIYEEALLDLAEAASGDFLPVVGDLDG